MLCNNQCQGPLYLKDMCVDARLPRALSYTSTVIGCARNIIYTVVMSALALDPSTAGILEETDVFSGSQYKKKILLRNQ